MKKIAILVAMVATLAGNSAFAQSSNSKNMGSGAKQATYSSSDNLAWGLGLGALAVVGTVVGVTVASAVSSGSSFSH